MEGMLLAGLLLGLASNFHCIGMCGPIAMAIPLNRSSNLSIALGSIKYNFGRIITYFFLGLIIGSIGITINTFGILQWLSIIAGIGLIFYAWRKYFNLLPLTTLSIIKINPFLNKGLGRIIKSKSPFKLLLLGVLNGLLPCGMVFVALGNALLTGEVILSGLAMIAFGIGTLPAMVAVTFMANKINSPARQKLNRIVPYMLTVVGLLIILRGMNLGIPFISPSVNVVEKVIYESGEVESTVQMDCCHTRKDSK